MTVFQNVASHSLTENYRYYSSAYCLDHQEAEMLVTFYENTDLLLREPEISLFTELTRILIPRA